MNSHTLHPKPTDYLYIVYTIAFTVYGQLVIKWRVAQHGPMPVLTHEKVKFLSSLFLDPFILSGLASAFVASIAWMAAMSKFNLSTAYPFMSLNFVIVVLISGALFREAISPIKMLGLLLIVVGTAFIGRG